MAIRIARTALGRIFFQRCFSLFISLLLLVILAPLVEPTPGGRALVNAFNLMIVVAAVATLGRTVASFVIALLLAGPTLFFHWLGMGEAGREMLMWSWVFAAALYVATLSYLLGYVFRYQRAFLLGLACVVVSTGIALAAPMVLRYAIDDLTRGVTRAKLLAYGSALLAIGLMGGLFRFLMRRILIAACAFGDCMLPSPHAATPK